MLKFTPVVEGEAVVDPKPLETAFKKEIDDEYADWYPGMDMFNACLEGFGREGFWGKMKVLFSAATTILGILETYSYMYTLYTYFKDGDYVWAVLSLISLIIYSLYVCFLVARKAAWMTNNPVVGAFGGLFLGIIQLGQPLIVYDSIFGNSAIQSEPSALILKKMDVFKVASFSLPQSVLQLYLFLGKHRSALPSVSSLSEFDNALEIFSICSSLILISLTISEFYKDKKSGLMYQAIAFIYSLSSTVLRVLMYCTVAAVFKWVVFILFAVGFIIRCFVSHPRPGDPYAGKFVYILSAFLFSFIINVDPNVPYIPILFLADIEVVIYIALAIYLPKRYSITFVYTQNFVFDEYWDKIIAAGVVLLVIMNVTSIFVSWKIRKMHTDNLMTLFYRFGTKRDFDEFAEPYKLPSRYSHYHDKACFFSPPEQRRYKYDPHPRTLIKYRTPKYTKSVQTMTKQLRVNPRCSEILAFRAEKLLEANKIKEALADCTYGMNPYFGLHYQDVGVTFNRLFYSPKVMPNFDKMNGTDPVIIRHLITRIACLIDLDETRLASLDRRRLALAAKIQGKNELIKMCLENPFPNRDNTKFLEIDDNIRAFADM